MEGHVWTMPTELAEFLRGRGYKPNAEGYWEKGNVSLFRQQLDLPIGFVKSLVLQLEQKLNKIELEII